MLRRVIVTLVIVTTFSRAALADRNSVGLVAPDPELLRAVTTALVPWQISVVAVDESDPGAEMPAAAEHARAIAARHDVDAVVWLSRSDGGHALWMYDADDERVVARRLTSPPPFDEIAAAAVALSVKTLLRHSAVPPPRERYAAALLAHERAAPTRLHFESTLGVRLRSGDGGLEPRLGLSVGWWLTRRVAVGLTLRSGPGVAVDEASFVGRFTDATLGVSARARFDLAAGLSVSPEAAASAHVTRLDGAVLDPEQRGHIRRTNPAAELAVTLEWRALDELAVGLRIGGAYLLRKQRYLVLGEPVFELPSTEWTAAVVLRTRLF